MSALPELGAIVNFGVGYDTTDVDAAAARGVVVSNTPDVLTDCVADTAVGLMIDVMRQFSAADRYVRAGRWPVDGMYPLTRQVSNTRVGIIGLGRIGSAIAKRLSALVARSPTAIGTRSTIPRSTTCRRRRSWRDGSMSSSSRRQAARVREIWSAER